MSNNLFNSTLENELKVLLVMEWDPKNKYSNNKLLALDFIICYARVFGFDVENLNGNKRYMFGEISSRRLAVTDAIKDLVVEGLVDVSIDKGYEFSISQDGLEYIRKMRSEYAINYRRIASLVLDKYSNFDERELMGLIQDKAVNSIRR